jgi:hypothetical protein
MKDAETVFAISVIICTAVFLPRKIIAGWLILNLKISIESEGK